MIKILKSKSKMGIRMYELDNLSKRGEILKTLAWRRSDGEETKDSTNFTEFGNSSTTTTSSSSSSSSSPQFLQPIETTIPTSEMLRNMSESQTSTSHSTGPFLLILICALLIPIICTSVWLLTLSYKRYSRLKHSIPRVDTIRSNHTSIVARSCGSWETVFIDLPSLLDPPEPAFLGIGRLWARVIGHDKKNVVLTPTDGTNTTESTCEEDSHLGPLEWYAKHTPPPPCLTPTKYWSSRTFTSSVLTYP